MKTLSRNTLISITAAIVLISGAIWWRVCILNAADTNSDNGSPTAAISKPALTVTTISPSRAEWPVKLNASGDIEAWQEALIGAEVNGLRLTEVKVNVGDTVQSGQLLATFSDVTVKADVAQALAAVAETEAMLTEARANADRTRRKESPGVFSDKQIKEYLRGEQTAVARLESARAQLANQRVRLEQTRLIAPDDGLISARSATVGAVVSAGQELFRLIRHNRLEWRAQVTSAELPNLQAGQQVTLTAPGGIVAKGVVRMVAPTVDPRTRMVLVYVDVPSDKGLKAGMFARGDFELGKNTVMVLPQSTLVQREGFNYVYQVGPDNKISQVKVQTGRRFDDQIEIAVGLDLQAKVVATGAAFLADGDTVRVVDLPAEPSRNGQ
jgi:RND family efflux transporter MFP subunit